MSECPQTFVLGRYASLHGMIRTLDDAYLWRYVPWIKRLIDDMSNESSIPASCILMWCGDNSSMCVWPCGSKCPPIFERHFEQMNIDPKSTKNADSTISNYFLRCICKVGPHIVVAGGCWGICLSVVTIRPWRSGLGKIGQGAFIRGTHRTWEVSSRGLIITNVRGHIGWEHSVMALVFSLDRYEVTKCYMLTSNMFWGC